MKKLYSFLIAIFCIQVMYSQDLNDGLVLHLNLDEGAGEVAANSATGATVAPDGALVNAPVWVPGKTGTALEFLHTGNAHVDLGTFDPTLGGNELTVSAWIKWYGVGTGGWHGLCGKRNGWEGVPFMFDIASVENVGTLQFEVNDAAGKHALVSTEPPSENEWMHMVLTFDGQTARYYFDGELKGEGPMLFGEGREAALTVGCGEAGGTHPWNGAIDEFRMYNRVLTQSEILILIGFPSELITSYENLDLGDLTNVTDNLTLPSSDGNISIAWSSSDSATIHPDGTVNRPDEFDKNVTLTATLSEYVSAEDSTYTISKSFSATVKALNPAADLLAQWLFEDDDIDFDNGTVVDQSSGWVGTLENTAYIRTIGETFPYNVLDLGGDGASTTGDAGGYFDMGQEIGEVMYGLNNFTLGCFFRIDADYTPTFPGNFLYSFCNTEDIYDGGGAMYMILRNDFLEHDIMPGWYTTQTQVTGSVDASSGTWHHFAFVQNGSTGSMYLDGQLVSQNTNFPTPANTMVRDTLDGTPFNWLGRSPYPTDQFLEKSQIYDFRLYSVPLSEDDINADYGFDVEFMLEDLNIAWDENNNAGFPETLNDELAALDLGDLSALTGGTQLDLPIAGSVDAEISISWTSSNAALIASDGMVTAPKYLDSDVMLTAELMKRGYRLYKEFPATVLADPATQYNSDLLISYNFTPELRNGRTVTDASEKAFTGTLMNNAKAREINDGATNYSILDLNDSTDYFDMGEAVGEVIYNVGDEFSISAFFLIKEGKTNLANNGNFIWAFSNSDSSDIVRNGYMFGRATNAVYSISSEYWAAGNQGTGGIATQPAAGEWHNMTYVQSDTTGITYLDGVAIDTTTITNYPNSTIPKEGFTGTPYNWLGRPNFSGDTWINPAMIYDFKMYSRALTPEEIATTFDADLINGLNLAYLLSPVGVEDVINKSSIDIDTSIPGLIRISGLKGNESVNVFDLVGRSVEFTNSRSISVKSGIYIVKVDDNVKKVFVK